MKAGTMKTFKTKPCVDLILPIFFTMLTVISLLIVDGFKREQELLMVRDWLFLIHGVLLVIEALWLVWIVWRMSRHLLRVSVDQERTIDLVWMLWGQSVRWDQVAQITRDIGGTVCITLKDDLKPIRFCLQPFDNQAGGMLWNALAVGAIMNDIPYQRA